MASVDDDRPDGSYVGLGLLLIIVSLVVLSLLIGWWT